MNSNKKEKKVNQTENREEVRTLFVSGLPDDLKQRELNILFHSHQTMKSVHLILEAIPIPQWKESKEGYEGTFLKLIAKPGKSPQLIAFVTFSTHADAEKAMIKLQGFQLDPILPMALHLEFANTNSRMSPKKASFSCLGRNHYVADSLFPDHSAMMHPNPFMNSDRWKNHPYLQGTLSSLPIIEMETEPGPCNTLFVANIQPQQNEKELHRAFMSCVGFVRTKMYTKRGPPVCFVEFTDIETASHALKKLQGYLLPGSQTGAGLRIEFAKQKMRDLKSTDSNPFLLPSSGPSVLDVTPKQEKLLI